MTVFCLRTSRNDGCETFFIFIWTRTKWILRPPSLFIFGHLNQKKSKKKTFPFLLQSTFICLAYYVVVRVKKPKRKRFYYSIALNVKRSVTVPRHVKRRIGYIINPFVIKIVILIYLFDVKLKSHPGQCLWLFKDSSMLSKRSR